MCKKNINFIIGAGEGKRILLYIDFEYFRHFV